MQLVARGLAQGRVNFQTLAGVHRLCLQSQYIAIQHVWDIWWCIWTRKLLFPIMSGLARRWFRQDRTIYRPTSITRWLSRLWFETSTRRCVREKHQVLWIAERSKKRYQVWSFWTFWEATPGACACWEEAHRAWISKTVFLKGPNFWTTSSDHRNWTRGSTTGGIFQDRHRSSVLLRATVLRVPVQQCVRLCRGQGRARRCDPDDHKVTIERKNLQLLADAWCSGRSPVSVRLSSARMASGKIVLWIVCGLD